MTAMASSDSIEVGSRFELDVDRIATGGTALGTAPDGRITFVADSLPGERVEVEVTDCHRSRLEATTTAVVQSSPHRVKPICRHVDDGCGGCDWQHIAPAEQARLRTEVVADCLRRLASLTDVPITSGPVMPAERYRTTVRVGVVEGVAAYRARQSHRLVLVSECLIAHPLVEEILVEGRFGAASEVTVRAGANTGDRMVIVEPTATDVSVPDDVIVVGADELESGRNPHYHEEIGGIRFQVSARSFFQCRPDGAQRLAELAGDAVAEGEGLLLDAYCGVGLFAALAGTGRQVVGVESNPSAAGDAVINAGPHARITASRFERWQPEPVGVVIADPARAGLKKAGVANLIATGASHMALISCDPASLARDAALLAAEGYKLDEVTVVDLFGQTSHVETVSRFVRG